LAAEGNAHFLQTNLKTAVARRLGRRSGHLGTPITRSQNQQATMPQSAKECGRPQTVLHGASIAFLCRLLDVDLSREAEFARTAGSYNSDALFSVAVDLGQERTS
jgi:hypothetical protein